MNTTRTWLATVICAGLLSVALCGLAAEQKVKAKPYTLKTCAVSDEKLGEMGDPYVFEYKGREIKLCCKNCLKDFNKAPEKYVKKIEKAEKGDKPKTK